MSKLTRGRDKWYFLRLGARWDRSVVPIYEAAAKGKCVPLLKTLLTTRCTNQCTYCTFRAGRTCPRMMWEPKKLADITMHLWKERKIQGLFLTSSVLKDPDYTMEKQLEVLRALRNMGYAGYIHLRIMPGVSRYYIQEAVKLADRVGVNLEAPSEDTFNEICPDKGGFKEAILKRLEWTVSEVERCKKVIEPEFGFAKAGVDTQMIVGAVDDDDQQFLQTTEWLYKKLGLKRVYFSGFKPVSQTPLERRAACSPSREYRLYQASFLIRDYGFKASSFTQIANEEGFLPNSDPKLLFAEQNPDMFPINLNTATYREIVRIPHIGPIRARKIIRAREKAKIERSGDLEKIVGAKLTRGVRKYVELKDKGLSDFLR